MAAGACAGAPGNATRAGTARLPERVDLSSWDVPVGDQGASAACVPWTIAYAMMGWYSRRQGHAGQPFAPMYAYSQVQLRNGFLDSGSYPVEVDLIAQSQGVPRLADYRPQRNFDWWTQPTLLQRHKAFPHRTTGARFLYATWPTGPGPGSRRAISSALASGHPVALSFASFPGFMSLDGPKASFGLADATGQALGGHEALVVGYDSYGVRIQNSWGTRWGDAGYARLSWDFVAAHSFDASVMEGFVDRQVQVDSVSPRSGPASAATTVTARGRGFSRRPITVFAGGRRTFARVVDASTLLVLIPPGVAGTSLHVQVLAGGFGSSPTATDLFTYQGLRPRQRAP